MIINPTFNTKMRGWKWRFMIINPTFNTKMRGWRWEVYDN
jgi:hypothetical protein